jgi:hypothetical protein
MEMWHFQLETSRCRESKWRRQLANPLRNWHLLHSPPELIKKQQFQADDEPESSLLGERVWVRQVVYLA